MASDRDERRSDPTSAQGRDESPRERADTADEGLYVIGQELPPPSEVNDVIVGAAAVVVMACAATFFFGLLLGAPLAIYGTALAAGLLVLAVAIRRYFAAAFPHIEALEPRHPADAEATGPVSDVERVTRRSTLQRLLITAAALFGASLVAPVTSLGPSPVLPLRRTAWERGRRLVTGEGEPIRPGDVALGGLATVWPEGAVGVETAAAILVRLSERPPEPPTNLDWVVGDELVAYSKVCTHAGCPVALFRERDSALFCPCHQSTFDASRGATPTFGPAARALPQLPLGVDGAGYLVALDDFTEQVGPAFG